MAKSNEENNLSNIVYEVSSCLVVNHLRSSFEPSEWNEFVESIDSDDLVDRRVVGVVGSGASNSAGLPLTTKALDILKEDSLMSHRVLDAELDRLSQTYKLDKQAFETHLRALSTSAFEAQNLRDNLQKMYGYRFMPVLGYEILAHMLKHRFLDAIINFNFDELLDQSIDDELNNGEYHHILSDGDCPDDMSLRNEKNRRPYYIKPHGTASHKSTLRFTREDYYGLPFDIQRVLRYLLTDKPVVLIIIGFGMQSLEFNRILEGVKHESKMFHINLRNPAKKFRIGGFEKNDLLKVSENNDISQILRRIWEQTTSIFNKEYRPREITRHKLISETFFREIKENNNESYLKGRTVIELCLSVAKGKGLVTMSQLSNDRSGKYFELYKAIQNDANFYDMCIQIGLKDIGYSREAMRLMKNEKMVSSILDDKEFDKEIDFLYARVQDNLDHISKRKLSKRLFRETLVELYDGLEIELRYKPHNPYTKIFQNPKTLSTYTAMKFYTKQMFKKDWRYLFVVAETGQWLSDAYFSRKILRNSKAQIFLLVADTSWENRLRKIYGNTIVSIRKLPWWEHNRHITILANENQIPFTGIYFSRRLRSANITPVFLNSVDDALVALESFNAYWIKASRQDQRNYDEKENWISASEAKNFRKLFEHKKDSRKK